MKCKDCKHLNQMQCQAAFKNIDGCSDFKPQTNGDRIRSSTNRELAKLATSIFISEIEKFSGCKIPEYLKKAQVRAIKKWLDSPVEKEKNW